MSSKKTKANKKVANEVAVSAALQKVANAADWKAVRGLLVIILVALIVGGVVYWIIK